MSITRELLQLHLSHSILSGGGFYAFSSGMVTCPDATHVCKDENSTAGAAIQTDVRPVTQAEPCRSRCEKKLFSSASIHPMHVARTKANDETDA